MRALVKSVLSLLFGGPIAVAFWIAPAQSAADGPITLRVPVELKKMVAEGVYIECRVRGDGPPDVYLGGASEKFPIVNGEFNQVVEFVIKTDPATGGGDLAAAKTYHCKFGLKGGKGNPYWLANPVQAPPGPDLWKRARPDEFFRWEITGPLKGVAVGGTPQGLKLK